MTTTSRRPAAKPNPAAPPAGLRPPPAPFSPDHIAPDCAGTDFWALDPDARALVALYLDRSVHAHLTPHLSALGKLAGGRLDEIARVADRHGPVLHARDRFGRNEDWIEYHPAYREMERIAFGDLQLHAMSHRAGVLGLDRPFPAVAKYAFQYLFVQAEFGIMCPVSVSDTSAHLVARYADPALKAMLLPRMLSGDMATLWKGTQFMTEKAAGSDVGAIETVARRDGDLWRLTGQKWFCSHTDADVALILARPEGAPDGTGGLALFALPRRLEDGRRNSYRIVRLKDKLGTRSMASGEIDLDGAVAYLIGDQRAGLKQMLDQVNLSRMSHGVRAAAMMRRCVNEALVAARHRHAFGGAVIGHPLMRRQLLKLIVPAEQALSVAFLAADAMDRAKAGHNDAAALVRILTPLVKLRACRDNIRIAAGAMEARGGNGYIEEWVTARLVRDAHIGVLWEGTSNIIAIDVVRRAVGKSGAGGVLAAHLARKLEEASRLPASFIGLLTRLHAQTFAFAEDVARKSDGERHARLAATALYNLSSAVTMAWESCQPGFDGRRALLSGLVAAHRLLPADPLAPSDGDEMERLATGSLLDGASIALAQSCAAIDAWATRAMPSL